MDSQAVKDTSQVFSGRVAVTLTFPFLPAWFKYCHLLPVVTALTYHDFHYLMAFIMHVYVRCILYSAFMCPYSSVYGVSACVL